MKSDTQTLMGQYERNEHYKNTEGLLTNQINMIMYSITDQTQHETVLSG